jgi:hypothetical protein
LNHSRFQAIDLPPQAVRERIQVVQVKDMPGVNVLNLYNPQSLGRLWPKPEDKDFPVLWGLFWLIVQ